MIRAFRIRRALKLSRKALAAYDRANAAEANGMPHTADGRRRRAHQIAVKAKAALDQCERYLPQFI